ncbi:hypothetical protein CDD82_4859 [Ophiocordyceps australis]|uniref:Uncharacterized protein n=1 Tax=Ophiocordyceps australis TaxID=1399860 RepID=A0A2C5ZLC1_9HYPO|nr:hypothetical protein CDD82_4859 [Ophiocordyceps australis]
MQSCFSLHLDLVDLVNPVLLNLVLLNLLLLTSSILYLGLVTPPAVKHRLPPTGLVVTPATLAHGKSAEETFYSRMPETNPHSSPSDGQVGLPFG